MQQEQDYKHMEVGLLTQVAEAQQKLQHMLDDTAAKAAEDEASWKAELDRLSADRAQLRRDYEQTSMLHEREMQEALTRYEGFTQQSMAQTDAAKASLEVERNKTAETRAQLSSAQEALSLERQARATGDKHAEELQSELDTLRPEVRPLGKALAQALPCMMHASLVPQLGAGQARESRLACSVLYTSSPHTHCSRS
jgi:chromosome segregation ATPase